MTLQTASLQRVRSAAILWSVPGPICVHCGGRLIGWGGYWRRFRRHRDVTRVWVPRRRCRRCLKTQGLLPASALERRLDAVETIGEALIHRVLGATVQATAATLELPTTTVRDWLARHRDVAPALTRGLMAWAIGQGSQATDLPTGEPQTAVSALGAAWYAWSRRPRNPRVGPWTFWSLITGGRALSTNTRPLFPFSADAQMMAAAGPRRPP